MILTAVLALSAMAGQPDVSGVGAPTVIVVVGAGGTSEYSRTFAEWADRWTQAAETAGANWQRIGPDGGSTMAQRDRFRDGLEQAPKEGLGSLWLVLIGHGTYDGQTAHFNLQGPDVSPTELAEWLQPFRRPLAVINCTAASSPFLPALSGPDRVVVTATRSAFEYNFCRFGQYIAEAIADIQADLDKDGQTSLLEAFLMASRRVDEFYELEGRLATEHALIDDNGDRLGTPADWFRGIRAVRRARDGTTLDGHRAHQFHLIKSPQERNMPPELRAQRDRLELDVARLRESKDELDENEYYRRLEPLLVALARVYEQADQQLESPPATRPCSDDAGPSRQ